MSGISGHQRQSHKAARPRWQRIALYLPTAIQVIFSAPFRADQAWMVSVPAPQRENRRRAAFLRLILTCALVLLILVLFPAAVFGNASTASLWRLGLVTLLAATSLFLNTRERTTEAGMLFISTTIALTLDYLVTNPDGLDVQAMLTLALFAAFILIAGLILPEWATWSLAGIGVATTIASVFLLPLAPPLHNALADPTQLRFAIAGPLILLQVFVALFSWIAARSNKATVQAVSQAFAREQELSLLKDQFITNVNHELRTPLMAMDGYIKLLRWRHQALSPERREELIEKAARAGDNLVTLVTSILETRHLEQTAEDFTPTAVALRATIEAAIRLAAAQIEETSTPAESGERTLRLHVSEDLAAWAEPVRVQQIFINLLSNAVKYSPPGTPIEVSARVVPSRWDASHGIRQGLRSHQPLIEITVRDFGFGIPPDQIPLLFERFVRLPRDLASNIAGNGLGLYLCRSFAQAMGGKIWVESSGIPGEGSTFHLQLPVPPPGAA
jgi:signal transduction histidine kinase